MNLSAGSPLMCSNASRATCSTDENIGHYRNVSAGRARRHYLVTYRSLMACFADVNVSQGQGSVATYARCAGIAYNQFTANILRYDTIRDAILTCARKPT